MVMMSSGGGAGQLFIIVYSYHLFLWHHFAHFRELSLSLKQPYGNKVKSSPSHGSDPDIDQINTTADHSHLQAGGHTLVGLR